MEKLAGNHGHDDNGTSTINAPDQETDTRNLAMADLSKKRAASPPHRPLTRSQTGRVPKRRLQDTYDTPSSDVQQKLVPPRKKLQTFTDSTPEDADSNASREITPIDSPSKDNVSDAPAQGSGPSLPDATQVVSEDHPSTESPLDRLAPRSRAVLPIPVPNLTKKSRGRRVPIQLATGDGNIDPKDSSRMYVCHVESCGKCFHRGEHLKRHIRSIHTHEKPFKCTQPLCSKTFNRHDNLLQHLKVHKEMKTPDSSRTEESTSPVQVSQSPLPPTPVARPSQLQPYYPAQEVYEASLQQARLSAIYETAAPFRTFSSPYGCLTEPTSLATNMAVSSLRTEIPLSPPISRKPHEKHARQAYSG